MLAGSNAEVADELRAHPGQWFLVAADDDLSRAHVYSQTAYRIRQNYREGKGLAAFAADEDGEFEAVATTIMPPLPPTRAAACEVRARFVPASPLDARLGQVDV